MLKQTNIAYFHTIKSILNQYLQHQKLTIMQYFHTIKSILNLIAVLNASSSTMHFHTIKSILNHRHSQKSNVIDKFPYY